MVEDRTLYDLCRRYQYYWRAYQKVKPLQDIYWSKYLKQTHDEIKEKLDEVTEDIMYEMAKKMGIIKDFRGTFHNNIEPIYNCDFNIVGIQRKGEHSVEIESDVFVQQLSKMLGRRHRELWGFDDGD